MAQLPQHNILPNNKKRLSYPILATSVSVLSLSLLSGCSQQKVISQGDERAKVTLDIVQPAAEPVSQVDYSPVIIVESSSDTHAKSMTINTHIMPSPSYNKFAPPNNQNKANYSNENYAEIEHNAVHATTEQAFATLSIDTDTGSYANVRRFLNSGKLPPADAVRVEELVNYFNYDFRNAKKQADAPFLVSTEVVKSPWHPINRIVKIGIKAEDSALSNQHQPPANLVFMVDVSGSMSSSDKLQLAKASLKMLTKQLRAQDTITLVTYAGNTQVALPPTAGNDTQKILNAIDKLDSGGSTNGEAAIKLAYQQAEQSYKPKGINRILMLTDGDFNVGVSDVNDMLDIVRDNRDKGITLSTLGFGQGNYNDYMMEQVADNGNGNYSYIDSLSEAKKVLIDEMSSTFNTVAKDVKIQVEFNPAAVSEWRLIGYENRILAKEDFNNDKVDAGELGAGKSVVALFEVTPVGHKGLLDDSRYQQKTVAVNHNKNELGFLKIRYKAPNGDTSKLISFPIANRVSTASADTNFAMAVAGYGQLLSKSKYVNKLTYPEVARLAKAGMNSPADTTGSRREFIKLVELADALD